MYTIEFQKRGLPHAHILLFLHSTDKPKTTSDVDSIITAEIPNKEVDPLAYQSVSQFMMHGPCGAANPQNSCMVKGQCSKHYLKENCSETTFDDNGSPVCRRRENDRYVTTMGMKFDNRWVIPHNTDLTVKYQAHINAEICNRTRSIKYLFKYINKGYDRATVVIEENTEDGGRTVREVDEIKTNLDCRYISASESC